MEIGMPAEAADQEYRVVIAPAGARDVHVQMQLGAYLLGGLTPPEEATVRYHLARCARCQTEHDELAWVAQLLSLGSANDLPAAGGRRSPVPPEEPASPAQS